MADPKKYEDYDWKELPDEVKEAAKVLKYTKKIWDNDGDTPLDELDWDELTNEQQEAAKVLGYDQKTWDEDGGVGIFCCF